MNAETLRALVTVLFGALAGGITNQIAIWMLFHPYEPPRLLGRSFPSLQGAIPKNKARLAERIGRAVATRLLTDEDLARTLTEPRFRRAFDARLSGLLSSLLERRRGPLAEALPPPLAAELDTLLADAQGALLDRLDDYLAGEEFRAAARGWAEALAEEMREEELGAVLTPEREQALAEHAERWIGEAVGGRGFERAVDESLERTSERLLEPDRTFEDVLPTGLVAAFERAVAGYLPLALERIGTLLEDPDARERVERVLHEVLDRFMRDLKFHQRLVAALVITPDTVDRVLEAVEREGAEKLSELLHDPALRDAMARSVNDAIVDFLRRPVTSVLGEPGDPSVQEAQATVAGWMLRLARGAQTREFLVEKLEATLGAAERRTWGEVFDYLPPERLADGVVAAARSDRAHALYRDAIARLRTRALERPIGRPAELLPADAGTRLERALSDPLWRWIREQVPAVVGRIDVMGRVEQKIRDYPTARLEQLIRTVTERELQLIVRLGYALGAVIGLVLVIVNILLP